MIGIIFFFKKNRSNYEFYYQSNYAVLSKCYLNIGCQIYSDNKNFYYAVGIHLDDTCWM